MASRVARKASRTASLSESKSQALPAGNCKEFKLPPKDELDRERYTFGETSVSDRRELVNERESGRRKNSGNDRPVALFLSPQTIEKRLIESVNETGRNVTFIAFATARVRDTQLHLTLDHLVVAIKSLNGDDLPL